jgi:excisionase family DNA binding protein
MPALESPAEQGDAVFMSVKDTARLLGVSTQHVYDLLNEHAFESRHIGRRRLVVTSSLREFIDSLPRSAG